MCIRDRTGINIQFIISPTTLIALECARKMETIHDLDSIVLSMKDSYEKYFPSIVDNYKREIKKDIIITLCMTGEGGALQIKRYLEKIIEFRDIDIIPLSMKDKNQLISQINHLKEEHNILYVIGTFNPVSYTHLPEEDNTKHFLISLFIQQYYREMLAYADEQGGRLKNKVIMYLDEIGTIPAIQSAEMMFSASRSRNISIVAIIQSLAQLEKNYGKEGASIIMDNCQDTLFGGFAPNSETAKVMSENLGYKTVLSGSVSKGKNCLLYTSKRCYRE